VSLGTCDDNSFIALQTDSGFIVGEVNAGLLKGFLYFDDH
jgi:hypothetical protein